LLAGEIVPREPLADHLRASELEAVEVVHVHLWFVAECLFVKVAEQVEGFNAYKTEARQPQSQLTLRACWLLLLATLPEGTRRERTLRNPQNGSHCILESGERLFSFNHLWMWTRLFHVEIVPRLASSGDRVVDL
jgi:hypothetical protein